MHEVEIRAEQDEVMLTAELDEQRIRSSDLDGSPPARVADIGGFDMGVTIRLKERERREAFDELTSRATRRWCRRAGSALAAPMGKRPAAKWDVEAARSQQVRDAASRRAQGPGR